jgi:hypothetical protein
VTMGSSEPMPGSGWEPHLGDRLTPLVGGELSHDSRERVLAHLATCEKCKADAASQRQLVSVFAAATPPEPTLGFLERLERARRIEDDPDAGFPITSLDATPTRVHPRREPRAERWTLLAARIAGDQRDMRAVWLAHLAGRPEDDTPVTARQQRRYALGFLIAAVRLSLRDGLGHLWRPVDWILATRSRKEAFIGVPPALLVLYIVNHDGVHTLLTEGWGWVGGCGASMFALVRWLERIRGIELAEGTSSEGE